MASVIQASIARILREAGLPSSRRSRKKPSPAPNTPAERHHQSPPKPPEPLKSALPRRPMWPRFEASEKKHRL
jgi:hypothetical protein